jgi:glycosyltransferase involved in cell wall biosynthesis
MRAPRLLPWPDPRRKENPYQKVVYAGLTANGIRIRRTPPLFSLIPFAPSSDWLHLNWPETLFAARDSAGRERKLARFVHTVRRVKRRGTKILWTMHNEFPHEEVDADLHRGANARLCELSDLIHVHFPQAAEHLALEYRADPDAIHVMPHPHYGDYYGEPIPKRRARAEIGIDEDVRVVLIFGYLRRYKGIESAVESLLGARNDRLRLLIAGKPEDDALVNVLRSAREEDRRLILRLSRIPDSEVAPLFAAADAFLLPSRRSFTSGSLMLALTYGLPVIAVPRNHASTFLGTSFFQPWEPPTTDNLTALLEALDDWLAGVRVEELERVRAEFDAERLSEGLSDRLRR